MSTSETGKIGEEVAANFLRQKNYRILDTNYQNNSGRRLGEIDLVARDEFGELVFVEVKTREYQKYKDTLPEENITRAKLYKLSRIANAYLRQHKLENAPYHFDAISVWLDQKTRLAKVKHIQNMFLS